MPLAAKRHIIDKVVRALPRIFANSQVGEAAAGAAMHAAVQALKPNGGKVFHRGSLVFLATSHGALLAGQQCQQ